MFGEYVEVDTSGRTDVDEETGGRIVQGNPDDKLIDARKMSDERLFNIWKISGHVLMRRLVLGQMLR